MAYLAQLIGPAVSKELLLSVARGIVCDFDPEFDESDAGCYECTLGTVPRRLETGTCLYHQAEAIVAAAKKGI